MEDQKKRVSPGKPTDQEEAAAIASRRIKEYTKHKEIMGLVAKKREMREQRRARRYVINRELLEINGAPAKGLKILDLSSNGARVELHFLPPFMTQISLKFALPEANKVFQVRGRVLWSKITPTRGRYEVGVQFYQNYWEIDQLLRNAPRQE